MWFWWFMFVSNVLIPLCMILAGWFMWKHCPKNINGYCGYRSRRSRMNMDTWKFAHDYCGKIWWKLGWIMLIPSILVQIPFYGSSDDTIGWVGLVICTIECAIMLISIIPTENALKHTFDENGIRRKL